MEVVVVEVAVVEVVEAVSGGIGTTSSGSWYWHCSSVGGSGGATDSFNASFVKFERISGTDSNIILFFFISIISM